MVTADDLMALVSLAGQTVVAAAVTDAWETTRERFARLFGRGTADGATERLLDATHSQISAAAPANVRRVKEEAAAGWVVRLKDLLVDEPGAEAELRVIVGEVLALLPAGSVSVPGYSLAAGRDVTIEASGGGVAVGVIHGNVSPPGPTLPGRFRG